MDLVSGGWQSGVVIADGRQVQESSKPRARVHAYVHNWRDIARHTQTDKTKTDQAYHTLRKVGNKQNHTHAHTSCHWAGSHGIGVVISCLCIFCGFWREPG